MIYIQVLYQKLFDMTCDFKKPVSASHLLCELRFFITCSVEQSDERKHHLICYGPALNDRRSRIWRNFQITSYHFFEVDDLILEHRAKKYED